MENNTSLNTKLTDESIIDLIRRLRNDLIKDFLDERFLKEYLAANMNVRDISNIKIEFIKKALKELLIDPVNTEYYKPIIENIKASDSAALTEGNDSLFYKELEMIFKKFAY